MGPLVPHQPGAVADRTLGRLPSLGGFRELLLLDRSGKGVAGVYATQVLPFFDEKAVQTFQAFETEVYRAI